MCTLWMTFGDHGEMESRVPAGTGHSRLLLYGNAGPVCRVFQLFKGSWTSRFLNEIPNFFKDFI